MFRWDQTLLFVNLNIQYLWSCIWVCLFFFWQTFPIYGFGIVSQRVLPELRYIMHCKNFRMIQQHIKQARARRRESEIQVEIRKCPTPLKMRVVCLDEVERISQRDACLAFVRMRTSGLPWWNGSLLWERHYNPKPAIAAKMPHLQPMS